MDPKTLLTTCFLALLPISELRGAIPYAVANGVPILAAFALSAGCNALVPPLAFFFLTTIHKLLYRWAFYSRLFDRFVERVRAKISAPWNVTDLVALCSWPYLSRSRARGRERPWRGCGHGKRKSTLFIVLGVLAAGMIVSAGVGLGITALSFFLKRV
jgi:hypothetical protein